MLEIFGRAERLSAALTRRIPASYVELARDDESGLPYVEVFPPATHPWTSAPEATRRRTVDWTGTTYRWRTGPDAGQDLPATEDEAAAAIAKALGTLCREQPAT